MDRSEDAVKARLEMTAQEGAVLREWAKHPGFTILKRWLDQEINDARNRWLSASNKDEAEQLRLENKGLVKVYDFVKKTILQGDFANNQLAKLASESISSDGKPLNG
jgi:hypothetical protein